MKSQKLPALFLGLLLIVLPATAAAAEEQTRNARKAALAWLQLVDQQQYQDSWEQAATLFKQQVEADTWLQQLSSVRKPMGELIERVQQSATYSTSLPGVPDGEYVVLQFRSRFANKKLAIETVTPMLDNGRWRVAGYYIR